MTTKVKTKRRKVAKKSYKLWITIEEHIEFTDGTEKYRDMKEEDTRSVGRFSKIEDAYFKMNTLGDNHQNEGDEDL